MKFFYVDISKGERQQLFRELTDLDLSCFYLKSIFLQNRLLNLLEGQF